MLSKSGVTRIMHNPPKGRVNDHIWFKKGSYLVINIYGVHQCTSKALIFQQSSNFLIENFPGEENMY